MALDYGPTSSLTRTWSFARWRRIARGARAERSSAEPSRYPALLWNQVNAWVESVINFTSSSSRAFSSTNWTSLRPMPWFSWARLT